MLNTVALWQGDKKQQKTGPIYKIFCSKIINLRKNESDYNTSLKRDIVMLAYDVLKSNKEF